MRRDVPSVRILPMSDRLKGFRRRSIEDVQRRLFLSDLPACGGRFRYPRSGLHAPAGTIVLFQFQARIIASAIFIRDEKFRRLGNETGSLLIISKISNDPVSWPYFKNQ